jgi:hypothetical protein
MFQQQEQEQDEHQKENETALIYSTTIATTTNIWFNGNEKRPAMYLPRDCIKA